MVEENATTRGKSLTISRLLKDILPHYSSYMQAYASIGCDLKMITVLVF